MLCYIVKKTVLCVLELKGTWIFPVLPLISFVNMKFPYHLENFICYSLKLSNYWRNIFCARIRDGVMGVVFKKHVYQLDITWPCGIPFMFLLFCYSYFSPLASYVWLLNYENVTLSDLVVTTNQSCSVISTIYQ